MRRLRLFVLATSLLLLPSRLGADGFYSVFVCNDGQVVVDVAAALKYDGDWEIIGWTSISPARCERVYGGAFESRSFWGGGSEAHLAFAFTDSTGVWGAAKVQASQVGSFTDIGAGDVRTDGRGDVTQSNVSICARRPNFSYSLKDRDPAAACAGDPSPYFLIPASLHWVPPSGMRLNFRVGFGPKDRAIPLGPRASTGVTQPIPPNPGSSVSTPPVRESQPAPVALVPETKRNTTAQMVLGGEIRLDGSRWRYADGTVVPRPLLDFVTGHPPLRAGERQHAVSQAPVPAYINEIRDVVRAFHACTVYADVTKSAVSSSVASVAFDFDDYGVVETKTTESRDPSSPVINVRRGVALANLDLADASMEDRGCVVLSISCKDGGVCARSMRAGEDAAYSNLRLYVNTAEQGNRVLKAFKALAPFYPNGGAVPGSR